MGDEQGEVSRLLSAKAHPLVVQVRDGVQTGQGGTALLLFAKGLLIHPGAKVDRLKKSTLEDLRKSGFCAGADRLCGKVGPGEGPDPLKGSDLADHAADPDANNFTVEADEGEANTPSTSSGAQGGQGDSDGERNEKANNAVGPTDDKNSEAGYSGATVTAFWMALLLALLLLAFVIVIRRSRGPVAVGHRAPSSGRATGGLTRAAPTRTTPAHAARGGSGSGGAGGDGGGDGEGGDESTTRLRVASAPRHGRHVGARPAHARTAVVRTELHPQGYVEVDRVLRRAVWAEPERPPPAPGSLVDVTDARDRDSDVLYAFPPTAARHAKGTPR
ncbi:MULTISPECIES: hypothetical protein [unclassified Streptomyces]|uniref:hypothetical protein n=1 Tax=unclassified Streptomyces TaxID=2593676 RepID=UPI002E766660|nr:MULTISPECIES: hypothetical protein [unclassified Streptomyces]MEE1757978.1 hypothetical protein [Streptomyces sp. SP18BB07]MEE1832868.1 hypothetical protein [Streptomyces sp. SP17KL33]